MNESEKSFNPWLWLCGKFEDTPGDYGGGLLDLLFWVKR